MKLSPRTRQVLYHRRTKFTTFAFAWSLLFLLGSWPVWKTAYHNENKIRSVSAELASLSKLSAAGVWLEKALQRCEPDLSENYDRFFPVEKQRETLFLELARIAKESDIDPFMLREIPIVYIDKESDEFEDELATEPQDEEVSSLIEQFAVVPSDKPATELHVFRLLVSFKTDYHRMTRFLAGLKSIPRALSLHNLSVDSDREGINVAMELDFYVQRTN